jgi:hypothetical protein
LSRDGGDIPDQLVHARHGSGSVCGRHRGAASAALVTGVTIIRISHTASGEVVAEGPVGFFDIMPFEGNYYISNRCLRTDGFRSNWIPGFCFYKFFYVWLDFIPRDGDREKLAAWLYWLPNPLLFFIGYRLGLPQASATFHIQVIA